MIEASNFIKFLVLWRLLKKSAGGHSTPGHPLARPPLDVILENFAADLLLSRDQNIERPSKPLGVKTLAEAKLQRKKSFLFLLRPFLFALYSRKGPK